VVTGTPGQPRKCGAKTVFHQHTIGKAAMPFANWRAPIEELVKLPAKRRPPAPFLRCCHRPSPKPSPDFPPHTVLLISQPQKRMPSRIPGTGYRKTLITTARDELFKRLDRIAAREGLFTFYAERQKRMQFSIEWIHVLRISAISAVGIPVCAARVGYLLSPWTSSGNR